MDTNLQAELGVGIMATLSLRNGWLFRAQPVLDYGIDGHLELMQDGQATGRMIAVQLKTGPTFFKRPTGLGWRHPVKKRHAKYWTDGSLPTIVVLVDPESGGAYWQEVSASTLRSTGKGFVLEVPRTQSLQDKPSWALLAELARFQHNGSRFERDLQHLPPEAEARLRRVAESDPRSSERLARLLTEGRFRSARTVDRLQADSPYWLTDTGFGLWRVIAAFADDHGHHSAARALLELHGNAGNTPDHHAATLRAANLWVIDDPLKAISLLDTLPVGLQSDLWMRLLRRLAEDGSARTADFDRDFNFELEQTAYPFQVAVFRAHIALLDKHAAAAVLHSEVALGLGPTSSSLMHLAANALRLRASTPDAEPTDLRRAADLIQEALTQRRRWAGDTEGFVEDLGQILGQLGRDRELLELCAPPPFGKASKSEAARRGVAKLAVVAAITLREPSAVQAVLDVASLTDRTWLEHSFNLSDTPVTAEFWENELFEALKTLDAVKAVDAAHELAWVGIDRTDTLTPLIESGAVDDGFATVLKAQAAVAAGRPSGLVLLRSLATQRLDAADVLAVVHMRAGELAAAAKVASQARRRFSSYALIDLEVDALGRLGQFNEADRVATIGLSTPTISREQRAALFRARAEIAANAERWSDVVDLLEESRQLPIPMDDSDAWNLIIGLLRVSRVDRASMLLRELELRPTNADLAHTWLYARSGGSWDASEVRLAIELAEQFQSDEISLSLTLHLLMRSPDDEEVWMGQISEGETNTWQERFQSLIEHHSSDEDGAPLQRLRGDVESLIALLRDRVEKTAAINLLIQRGLRQRIPSGAAAMFLNRPYAYLYDQKPLGIFPAVSANDDAHDDECKVAAEALGRDVVIDVSALILLNRVEGMSDQLAVVSSALSPGSAVTDLLSSAREARLSARSAGSTTWDTVANALVYSELTEEAKHRLSEDAAFYENLTHGLDIVAQAPKLPELEGLERSGPWTDPIALAKQMNLPLWSDDEGQRMLARHLGVATFGTASMLEALAVQSIIASPTEADLHERELRASQLQLVRSLVTGVPLSSEDIELLADEEHWSGQVASRALAAEHWWLHTGEPVQVLSKWFRRAAGAGENALPLWEWNSLEGAVRLRVLESTPDISLAVVLLVSWDASPDPTRAHAMIARARTIANIWSVGDPAEAFEAASQRLLQVAAGKDWHLVANTLQRALHREETTE